MAEHPKSLIASFVGLFESQTKAAHAAGVSQPVVSDALKTGRVGPKLAIGIEFATDGAITRADLRPDLWPPLARVHASANAECA